MFINYEYANNVYSVSVERREDQFYISYENSEYKVEAEEVKPGHLKIKLGDRLIKCVITEGERTKYVFADGDVFKIKKVELTAIKKGKIKNEVNLDSPISGKVVNLKVKKGDVIKKGDILMIIEAMKMEYLIRAPYDGKIKKVNFKNNDQIEIGQETFEIDKN
jgi:3-methylcrotonyl-CoA carboxylase alpha subunit